MKNKSQATEIFKEFHKLVLTQFKKEIRVLRTDNGREYFDKTLSDYLATHGILHQSSCVNTSQQNGVAERKNRHLLETTRALMLNMHVPTYLWGEAILTATYLINRLPSRILNFKTPIDNLKSYF